MSVTYTRRLDAEDWVLIGYLIGIGVMWFIDYMATSPTTSTCSCSNQGQSWRLDERELERLEDGDSVTVPRWHGCDLVLKGDVVVPVPSETEDDE